MRILLVVDVHSGVEALERVLEKEETSKVFCLGDYCKYLTTDRLGEVLALLKKRSAYCIPGNTDFEEIRKEMKKQGLLLHNSVVSLQGHSFIAYGGASIPEERHFWNHEEKIYTDLKKLFEGKEKTILLTHTPAYNTSIDLAYNGEHIGSESVRKIIEEEKPSSHFCGHVHEAKGEEKVGDTLSVNLGPVRDGNYAILYIEKEGVRWERKKL